MDNHSHLDAILCDENLLIPPDTKFEDAAATWLDYHSMYIGKRSIQSYHLHIRTLEKVFSGRTLQSITPRDIVAYQRARISGSSLFARKVGPRSVNYECNTLAQIMDGAGIRPKYRQFPI